MITEDERKRDIEDVARKLGISEDAIDAIVNGKPLPRQKREPRIKKWNTGWELRDLLSPINIQLDFFDAVIEGKLTPYDENGLEIIDSYIFDPFRSNPPGCRYATITYDKVFEYFYKGEDIKKFLSNISSSPDAKVEVQEESIPKQGPPVSGYFSAIGKKGGKKPKQKRPILAAVIKYMKENPKIHYKTNGDIAKTFCNKYKENNPMIVSIDGTKWEIYSTGDYIFFRMYASGSKKANNEVNSITSNTLRKTYIPEAKKPFLSISDKSPL